MLGDVCFVLLLFVGGGGGVGMVGGLFVCFFGGGLGKGEGGKQTEVSRKKELL